MSQRTCGACDQPIRTQRSLCHRCEDAARTLLSRQADLRRELFIEYRKQVHKTEQLRILHNGETPILFEEKAARLIIRQVSWLTTWAVYCMQGKQAPTPRPLAAVESSAAYITAALPRLRKLPDGAVMVNELRKLTAEIIVLIDLPEVRTRITAGPCPEHDADGDHCSGQIDAFVPADERIPAVLRCSSCRKEWPSWQWNRAGDAILARKQALEQQRELALALTKGAA